MFLNHALELENLIFEKCNNDSLICFSFEHMWLNVCRLWMHLEAYCLVHDRWPMVCIYFASALYSIQWAPSWKGLHTLVVQPPNVGKGYAIVMSESRHEVYMFMLEKSNKCWIESLKKKSLILSLKEMKNKRLNGV